EGKFAAGILLQGPRDGVEPFLVAAQHHQRPRPRLPRLRVVWRPPEGVFQQRQEVAGRHPRAGPPAPPRPGRRAPPRRPRAPPPPRPPPRGGPPPRAAPAAPGGPPAVAAGAPPQRDAVVGGRGVGDVAGGVARHVAIDAVVVVLLAPHRRPLRAGLVG